jgi:secondary thiamine-phosphate synthase enzyme
MKIKLSQIEIQTTKEKQLLDITEKVGKAVQASGVKQGMVFILTLHTSSGIIVTEGLDCLEADVLKHLETLAPDQGNYLHNRYLDIDGRVAFNAGAHLKSILGGYHAFFPIAKSKLVKGSRQRIFFAEYDGPLARTYCVQVMGE